MCSGLCIPDFLHSSSKYLVLGLCYFSPSFTFWRLETKTRLGMWQTDLKMLAGVTGHHWCTYQTQRIKMSDSWHSLNGFVNSKELFFRIPAELVSSRSLVKMILESLSRKGSVTFPVLFLFFETGLPIWSRLASNFPGIIGVYHHTWL
jgi:hypothetical protein